MDLKADPYRTSLKGCKERIYHRVPWQFRCTSRWWDKYSKSPVIGRKRDVRTG
jgi:hypothetical protein